MQETRTRCDRCGKLVKDSGAAERVMIRNQVRDLCPDCFPIVAVAAWSNPAEEPDAEPVLGQMVVQRADVERPPIHGRPAAEIEADTLSGHGTPLTQA